MPKLISDLAKAAGRETCKTYRPMTKQTQERFLTTVNFYLATEVNKFCSAHQSRHSLHTMQKKLVALWILKMTIVKRRYLSENLSTSLLALVSAHNELYPWLAFS